MAATKVKITIETATESGKEVTDNPNRYQTDDRYSTSQSI